MDGTQKDLPALVYLGSVHEGIPVRDLDRAVKFYTEVLGLKLLPRPNLPAPGAWLGDADNTVQFHLIVTEKDYIPGPEAPMTPTGRHTAWMVKDLNLPVELMVVPTVREAGETLLRQREHWFVRETLGFLRRTLRRLDASSRSLFAVADRGACFVGLFLELALACDRLYMLDDGEAGEGVVVVAEGAPVADADEGEAVGAGKGRLPAIKSPSGSEWGNSLEPCVSGGAAVIDGVWLVTPLVRSAIRASSGSAT